VFYDCAAPSIRSVPNNFGSTTYNDVNSWAQAQWGTLGVPLSSFITTCDQYLNGQQITLTDNTFSNNNGMPPSGQKVVVVMNISGEYHAGVLISCSNGSLVYSDYIGGGMHIADTNQIVNSYQAWGCD